MANIGPEQRRRRRVLGAWTLAAGAVLSVLLLGLGDGPWPRLLAAPLFLIGFSGVFQSREHT
jgi:hypothetical protein